MCRTLNHHYCSFSNLRLVFGFVLVLVMGFAHSRCGCFRAVNCSPEVLAVKAEDAIGPEALYEYGRGEPCVKGRLSQWTGDVLGSYSILKAQNNHPNFTVLNLTANQECGAFKALTRTCFLVGDVVTEIDRRASTTSSDVSYLAAIKQHPRACLHYRKRIRPWMYCADQ